MHRVEIAEGNKSIVLPNGRVYDAGEIADLTDDEYGRIDPSLLGSVVTDLGTVGIGPTNAAELPYDDTQAANWVQGDNVQAALESIDGQLAYYFTNFDTTGSIHIIDEDGQPNEVVLDPSTIVAKLASGGIVAATPSQIKTLLGLDNEGLQDLIGSMVGTQSGITVTYNDTTGQLDFTVPSSGIPLYSWDNASSTTYGLPGWAHIGTWQSGFGLSSGDLVATPVYVQSAITITALCCMVNSAGAAGTLARLGVYDATGARKRPGALVVDAGTVSVATTGAKETSAISTALSSGLYWLMLATNASVTFACPQAGAGTSYSIPLFMHGGGSTQATMANVAYSATGQSTTYVTSGLPATAPTPTYNYGGWYRNPAFAKWTSTQ